MNIGDRLKYLRKNKLKMTQSQCAEKLNISIPTYSRYESNKFNFNDRIVSDICREFKINSDWLLYGKGEVLNNTSRDKIDEISHDYGLDNVSKNILKNFLNLDKNKRTELISLFSELLQDSQDLTIEKPQIISLPFYNDINASAGLGSYLDSDAKFEIREYIFNRITRKADHVIKIKGNSMEPTIIDSSEVFIHEQPAINNNDIGIFVYDGELYCKRLVLKDNKVVLKSDNKKYKDIVVNKNLEFITVGKVLLS